MVGTEREVLVVEPGTGRSVKCRDDAYRQLIIQDAADAGVSVGDRLTVEVTAPGPVYAFCEPA
jgi:tRNA A37 methylthiotransferase MiaB